jgi:hypothetical protein
MKVIMAWIDVGRKMAASADVILRCELSGAIAPRTSASLEG